MVIIAIGIVITLIVLLFAGPAARIRKSLQPFVSKTVHVTIWGAVPDESDLVIVAVMSFGAGLVFFLRRTAGGKQILLKVAQPQSASITATGITIAGARYVQWDRRRVAGDKTKPAAVLDFRT